MHGLPSAELRELNKWTDVKLLDTFEGYSDRVYLIAQQNANGVAHKSTADPDVASLIATYEALKTELEKRLKVGNKALATTLEGHSRVIAHHTAYLHGTLGIPNDEKLAGEVAQTKADYNATYAQIETVLSG